MKRLLFPVLCLLALAGGFWASIGHSASTLFPVQTAIKSYTDNSGQPLQNGYVYFGQAKQNPEVSSVTVYWDAAGTLPTAQPLRTVNGYIYNQGSPANVYAVGDYSITVRDKYRNLVFTLPTSTDQQTATATVAGQNAASIVLADSGNYYSLPKTIESALQQLGPLLSQLTATTPTGARIGYVGSSAPAGWVFGVGRTIGDVASNATERNNSDTSPLYTLLWNSYGQSTAILAIQDSAGSATTYGVSAAADYAAHKRLCTPDYRNRAPVCFDFSAGGYAKSSRITVAGGNFDGTVMGAFGGLQSHTLITSELASHTHTWTNQGSHTHTDSGHTHAYYPAQVSSSTAGGATVIGVGANPIAQISTGVNTSLGLNNATTSGTTNGTGSGTAHTILQPTIVEEVIIKL